MSHAHHHNRPAREALGVTWLGLVCNLLLAAGKGFVGLLTNSAALIADAGHSFSDLLSDGVTLWALWVSRMPRDENHPYGHGRFETVGALLVSVLLGATGIGVAVHAFSYLNAPVVPASFALWAAGVSIFVKEGLFWITRAVGRRQRSRVLMANAWHHRSDALSSVAALAGIGAAQFGFPLMDPIAGFLVAGLILRIAVELGHESLRELTDETADDAMLERIHGQVAKVEGVEHFHEVRARPMGPNLLVDLHIEVDRLMTVSAAHQVAERVRWGVLNEIPEVNEVLVHVDAEQDLEEVEMQLMRPQPEIEQDIRGILAELPEIKGVTHIYCHFLKQALTVQVNLLLDPDLQIRTAQQIARQARLRIEQIPDVQDADIHLELHDGGTGHEAIAVADA
jgi:cation diffusion facilitator family transporter